MQKEHESSVSLYNTKKYTTCQNLQILSIWDSWIRLYYYEQNFDIPSYGEYSVQFHEQTNTSVYSASGHLKKHFRER